LFKSQSFCGRAGGKIDFGKHPFLPHPLYPPLLKERGRKIEKRGEAPLKHPLVNELYFTNFTSYNLSYL
jgi:hypothetical protein